MEIKVNGKIENLPVAITLKEYLETHGYSPDKVLASLNGIIIQPNDYDTILPDQAELELMTFVAGG